MLLYSYGAGSNDDEQAQALGRRRRGSAPPPQEPPRSGRSLGIGCFMTPQNGESPQAVHTLAGHVPPARNRPAWWTSPHRECDVGFLGAHCLFRSHALQYITHTPPTASLSP